MRLKKSIIAILTGVMMISVLSIGMKTMDAESEQDKDNQLKLGVEVLLDEQIDKLQGKNIGLITNPTGVDSDLNSIVDRLHNHTDVNLVAMYGPEHGVRGDAQAGTGVDYYIDEKTGLPVYSLYGDTKKPTPEMLEGVDVLLFDIQDVGARFYTYIYTMAYAMEAAEENDIEIIVLDRPNPIGGDDVEGPVLDEEYSSFVGMYPIPQRHGMTVGELANFFNEEFDIQADLDVIEMKNWKRLMYYNDTDLHWVLPSPNMPTLDTAMVYPGTALIEGTNLSEGRGTTKPFELIGAPFIDGDELAATLNDKDLSGAKFRSAYFTPSMSKHSGSLSGGIEVYVTNREEYESIRTGLTIVKTIHDMYPDEFEFSPESQGVSFFDKLTGNKWVRDRIEEGVSVDSIVNEWESDLSDFRDVRRNYLLYELKAKDLVDELNALDKSDDIYDEEALRTLKMHLIAVENFEKKEQRAKVFKHMNGFSLLLDQLVKQEKLSEKAYDLLSKDANSLAKQWK